MMLCATVCGVSATLAAGAADPVTAESLLAEMLDPAALARWPEPAYVARQFSSYDRASVSPAAGETWFANNDAGHFLRVDETGPGGRREWVLAEMEGPGAVVRIWSANPKGTLRVYLDGGPEPVIEGPMGDLLGGKGPAGEPLSHEASRGWNLYLPIPYAKRCRVTSDEGGFYYHVNHRAYGPGTAVETLSRAGLEGLRDAIAETNRRLAHPEPHPRPLGEDHELKPGESFDVHLRAGPADGGAAVEGLWVRMAAADLEQASRSVVLTGEFDGERTIWCPVGDFFGSGVGLSTFSDLYRSVDAASGEMSCRWVMPFREGATFKLVNLGASPVTVAMAASAPPRRWDDRSMHFHARWRREHPIRAEGGRGTADWNYLTVTDARGVFVGDNLSLLNPVADWWGEGDEKIFVDGEEFPSHFGTGTEDYYGYAWCSPRPFVNPFHAQPRCDGWNGGKRPSNWGRTSVTRVRPLDAIPFERSFRFDMEVWHWKACEMEYAATTYFYARPGARVNLRPDEAGAAAALMRAPERPRAMVIAGAIECEGLPVAAKSEGLTAVAQDMEHFARGAWSDGSQLWVQGRRVGDFVEVEIPVPAELAGAARVRVALHATRSWDYGVVKFLLNDRPAGEPVDLFSGARGKVEPTGPIDLGSVRPREGAVRLRAEVVGGNDRAEGTRSFFGLDCVVISASGG